MMRAILYTILISLYGFYENGGCYAICLEYKMLDTNTLRFKVVWAHNSMTKFFKFIFLTNSHLEIYYIFRHLLGIAVVILLLMLLLMQRIDVAF